MNPAPRNLYVLRFALDSDKAPLFVTTRHASRPAASERVEY
jgi:hypothetical protein